MDTEREPVPGEADSEAHDERMSVGDPAVAHDQAVEPAVPLEVVVITSGETFWPLNPTDNPPVPQARSHGHLVVDAASTEVAEVTPTEVAEVTPTEVAEVTPTEVAEVTPTEVAEVGAGDTEPIEVGDGADAEPFGVDHHDFRHRNIVAAIIGGTLVVIVILVLIVSARDEGPPKVHHEGQQVAVTGRVDTFDRPDNATSLDGGAAPLTWTVGAGTFGILGNQGFAAPNTVDRSVVVVNMGQPDGAASVRLPALQTNAGLVFRYRNPNNYWAVVAVREYASWAIVRTVNGRQRVVTNTGLSTTSDGTVVGVRLRGDVVDVTLDGAVVRTITDPTLDHAPMIGLTAMGPGPDLAHFDDFTVTLR